MVKLKYILFLCFSSLALFTAAQKSSKYPALLWKISGKGMKKPSYLYGTMHVSNRVAWHLSEQFFDALKSVEVVGLETNPGEWLQNMEKTGELNRDAQFTNAISLGGDFYRNCFSLVMPDKAMLQGIIAYDPDLINGLLYRHSYNRENFEENTYVDLFIFQSASKLNKKVISLEDFTQSEIKSRLSSLPDAETHDEESIEGYRNKYVSPEKIEDAYRAGDLDLLDSLSKRSGSKNMQKYLIDDRNDFFVHTMDSVMRSSSIFAGVGAAHLPGEHGVIELLRKLGYQVEPVKPTVSKKSDKQKEELDAMVKPVVFSKQFVNDSLMSLNVPGPLLQIATTENIQFYLCADMVNGSYYTIARIKYFGPAFGVTGQVMAQRVDSLLFENIPGKILLKKEIVTQNGIKGIEVISKTRTGNEQHYQIYFTEMEMFFIKLGSKGTYATGNDAKQFFTSIQFADKGNQMVKFTPPSKGVSVKLPLPVFYNKNNGSSVKGLVEDIHAYDRSNGKFYGVKHAVYNDFEYLEEDTFELNVLARYTLRNYKFEKDIRYETSNYQKLPAIQFSATNDNGANFSGKIVIKGVHYYLFYVISKVKISADDPFFKSAELNDFVCLHPIKEITDPEMHFVAKDEVTNNQQSRFNEMLNKAIEEAKGTKKKDKYDSTSRFDYYSSNKYYYSPSSNEYVNIFYEKFNDYDHRNLKEIEEFVSKRARTVLSMNETAKYSNTSNGVYTYTCLLKDTATSRAVMYKTIIKNGARYELFAPMDTTIGLTNWTKEFFYSFHPKDTIIGKDLFTNRFPDLLRDLSSNDTAVRKRANISIQNSIGMHKSFVEDYIKLLNHPSLNLINEDSRAQLFVNGGTVESERIIDPYKKLYKQYTDSFYYQLSLLKGLAYLKTQNSYNALQQLLLMEAPLVGQESVVADVFNLFHDSLELCKKFFPGMLSLTKFEEYRNPVYTLLADLMQKGIVQSSLIAMHKDDIQADATLALKRYNPNLRQSQNSDLEYLDKASRELAEQLQSNLEGLNNNNLFKGTSYLRSIERSARHELVNYACILSPFYKSDPKAKAYFEKLNKIKSNELVMPVYLSLLRQGVVLNDTLGKYFCKNKITRVFYYTELEKSKLTGKFDASFLKQEEFVESVLYSQRQLNGIYNYERDKKNKDSLVWIKTVPVKNKYRNGHLYFYKVPAGKFNDEQVAVAFAPSGKTISTNIEVIYLDYRPEKNKSLDENMTEILNDFHMMYHKRAGADLSRLYNQDQY